jgi:hypothetical protein
MGTGKVIIQKMTDSTPEQRASAERNRDALTLMSLDDRNRYAGRIAVVVTPDEGVDDQPYVVV